MSGMEHSTKRAARLWWATLPYYGWVYGGPGGIPAPWWAHPLAWVHRVVAKLPSHAAYKPVAAKPGEPS